jgi:SMC interacting uncharacterized protein involved in chromosome segregation
LKSFIAVYFPDHIILPVMIQQKSKSKTFLNWILPFITAAFGCILTIYLTPKDKSFENLMTVQYKQIDTLSNGFNNLIAVIQDAKISDPNVFRSVNSLGKQFNSVIGNINDNNAKLNKEDRSLTPIKTELQIPPEQPIEKKDAPIVNAPEKIEVKIGDSNTAMIDNENYFSILKEQVDGYLSMMLNGASIAMINGTKRSLVNSNGSKYDFVYKGKENGNYVFLLFKGTN